jgi:hypothetical protein
MAVRLSSQMEDQIRSVKSCFHHESYGQMENPAKIQSRPDEKEASTNLVDRTTGERKAIIRL